MTRPQRPCLGVQERPCPTLTRNPKGRCAECQKVFDRLRNQARTQYQGAWAAASRTARKAEPWCHCDLAGHGHDGMCSRTEDLTLDHQYGRVECRSCNSAHRREPLFR